MRPGIARREHARRTSQRINDQTRVVRHYRKVRETAVVQRLAGCVFAKRGRGFFKGRQFRKSRKKLEVERNHAIGIGSQRAEFFQLAEI
jgi:hypothetical protein